MVNGTEHFKAIFFEECRDLLFCAEESLNNLSIHNVDMAQIHSLFRCIHSIKGGAGSFAYVSVVDFSHAFEAVLEKVRSQTLPLTETLKNLMLQAIDVLSAMLIAEENQKSYNEKTANHVKAKLLKTLEDRDPNFKASYYSIAFIPHENFMYRGNEVILLLQELKRLSSYSDAFQVTLNSERLPFLQDLVFDQSYLSWDVFFATEASHEKITEVFEFVTDLCTLVIIESTQHKNPAFEMKADDVFQKSPLVQTGGNFRSLRVDLERLDRLVNTVGEIVIKQSMLLEQTKNLQDSSHITILKTMHELISYTRELQENVMSIRAQPIKTLFSRIPRTVRELSFELKKNIVVQTFGENTEIDKTVIEHLSEPLMHMIRNAVDHGIEPPEERETANKPKHGNILLSAEHKNGRIVVQIQDDGRGIDRQRILKKAAEKGLISVAHNLTDEEIDNLIFLPGFSTAETLSTVSGRGVGMDVVKKTIQNLGGEISLTSQFGKGCTITLTLPLTLAVLDGMLVRCGYAHYVIPIINIIETLRPLESQVSYLLGGACVLHLRASTIPLIFLSNFFNAHNTTTNPCHSIVVIMETETEGIFGLVVDELEGQQQVVIKSLETNYSTVPGISAATIMGNGSVYLILDVNALYARKEPKSIKKLGGIEV